MSRTGPGIDETFAALSDPTRRRMVERLSDSPMRAGELARAFELTAPATSRHLKVLRDAGLVEDERHETDARVRLYRLRRDRFEAIRSWVREVEAFWEDQLDAFKAHAERQPGASVVPKRADEGEP